MAAFFAYAQVQAQFIHKIKADSVLITNDSCTAELNLENSTKHILGFLYNKGNGRTEFRKALIKINDSTFLIGEDTLKVKTGTPANAWLQGGNAFGATGVLGTTDNQPVDFYTNNTRRASLLTNGNLLIGTTTDNGRKLHVNGTTWLGSDVNVSHPTFATGGATGAGMRWVADNTFRVFGGPQETLTFGPSNAITSNSLLVAPVIYANSGLGINYYVPGGGGVYSSANNPGNTTFVMHKFSCALPQANSGAGGITLMELNKPVNRGIQDGLEVGLRIKFTVTGTANYLRALETINGVVKLNISSGRTSIGLDSATAATSRLDVNGEEGYNQLRLRKNYTPTSSADSNGNTGDVCWDDNYFYIKTSTGWKRSALTGF